MKKLLCILLSCLLVFNSVTLVYADEHGGSGGSFDPIVVLQEKHPDWFDKNGHVKPTGSKLFDHMIAPDLIQGGAATVEALASITGAITEFLNGYDNSEGDVSIKYKDNGQPVTENNYNENNFYITYSPKFLNGLNDKLQNKVHTLDGYYLLEPVATFTADNIFPYLSTRVFGISSFKEFCGAYNVFTNYKRAIVPCTSKAESFFLLDNDAFLYSYGRFFYNSSNDSYDNEGYTELYGTLRDYGFSRSLITVSNIDDFLNKFLYLGFEPLKIFYSKQDLQKYLKNDKTISYAPKLPSTNLTIPLGYANGTLNLPDFNINLDSLIGKAEADIQADIDNQFKLYLDKLAEINVNPSQPTNPTPTPSGGGSGGDFGDGTTPTPAPDFTDGLKDTNDYLKQILEKVTSILQIDTEFSKSFETVSQNLCKYLESNNEKLDQIITAINALSNGKTEDEVNGCKYDFTELSQSLTSLWNDSDQKFDQMIKLLEENNKYQEKIIGDLNDIKAILIAQTVLDAFQNRSQETANKAKEKFPTSIPWDIAMIVNTFSAEPEPIKFELPIKVNSLNINETITVDLSSGEWEKLGKLCRYMLSVLFILFLIQLSRKLFSNGGDE